MWRLHWGKTLVYSSFRSDLRSDQTLVIYLAPIIRSCSLSNCDLDHRFSWLYLTLHSLDMSLFSWVFNYKIRDHFNMPYTFLTRIINVTYNLITHVGNVPCACIARVNLGKYLFWEVITWKLSDLLFWLSVGLSASLC